ncbi:hypothetical protein ASG35_17545 [Burkholderia sp. Leaf177]|nr:hypothetical protein ASG35_17545 [Burkholderia sp. Leaf177]
MPAADQAATALARRRAIARAGADHLLHRRAAQCSFDDAKKEYERRFDPLASRVNHVLASRFRSFGQHQSARKCGESAINSFDLSCKWPSNAFTQGVLVAFIPKNG